MFWRKSSLYVCSLFTSSSISFYQRRCMLPAGKITCWWGWHDERSDCSSEDASFSGSSQIIVSLSGRTCWMIGSTEAGWWSSFWSEGKFNYRAKAAEPDWTDLLPSRRREDVEPNIIFQCWVALNSKGCVTKEGGDWGQIEEGKSIWHHFPRRNYREKKLCLTVNSKQNKSWNVAACDVSRFCMYVGLHILMLSV